jgi:hypothetical protein
MFERDYWVGSDTIYNNPRKALTTSALIPQKPKGLVKLNRISLSELGVSQSPPKFDKCVCAESHIGLY